MKTIRNETNLGGRQVMFTDDREHSRYRHFGNNARLEASYVAAVRKDTGEPWLEIHMTETSPAGRRVVITTCLEREELLRLRDMLNEVLL